MLIIRIFLLWANLCFVFNHLAFLCYFICLNVTLVLSICYICQRVDEAYGLKKECEIVTEGIDVWHVAEFACSEMDEAYHGNFFDGDTYVVRWRYQVDIKGMAFKNI